MFILLLQITQVLVQLQDRTENRVTKQNLKTVVHKVMENQTRYSWHCQFHSPTFLTPTISASTIVFVTYVIQVTTNNLSGSYQMKWPIRPRFILSLILSRENLHSYTPATVQGLTIKRSN